MGLFSEDFIRRVRDANDILQVVESYSIALRRAGGNFIALCPFHNEKTPSFNINPQKQMFKCFGCGVGGDVIKFVQLMEREEFPEAIETLATRAGLEIEREAGNAPRPSSTGPDSKDAILWINRRALDFFENRLEDVREGTTAREYLLGRGFTKETISAWRLGWAPDEWNALLEALVREAGEHKREKTIEAGLCAGVLRRKESESGGTERVYDAFRGRVMFPIFNNRHQPIGFGGRVLGQDKSAKYVNTAEGKLFQKRKLLYGLNFAAKEIGLTRTVIIVEGYTDTIMCHQHGIRNAVATLGTSLTRDHIQQIRRYIQPDGKVIALFDSDQAGEAATLRAIQLFMEEDVPLHIVRGLEVKDACEFLPRFGADAFRAEMDKAVDAFHFSLQRDFGNADADVSSRAAAVESIMQLVNRCPNNVKRAMMRREVADRSGVPEEALPRPRPATGNETARQEPRPAARRGLGSAEAARDTIEKVLEGSRKKIETRLASYMLDSQRWCETACTRYPPERFVTPACAEIARLIQASWQRGERPDGHILLRQGTEEETAAILAEIDWEQNAPPKCDEELNRILNRVEAARIEEELARLASEARDAEQKNDRDRLDSLLVRKLEYEREIRRLKAGGASRT